MAPLFRGGACDRRGMEQTIDAGAEVAVAGEQRSGEIRQRRRRTHASDAHQRGGKRESTARISRSGLVIGGPLREFRPAAFER